MMELRAEAVEILRDHNRGKLLLAKSVDEFQSLRGKYRDQLSEVAVCMHKLELEKVSLEKEVAGKELILAEEKAARSQAERALADQAEEQEKLSSLTERNQKEILQMIKEVKSGMEIVHPLPENPQLDGIDKLLQEIHSREAVVPGDIKSIEDLLKGFSDR